MRWMGQEGVGGERSLAGTTKNHHAWQGAGALPRRAKDGHKTSPPEKPP